MAGIHCPHCRGRNEITGDPSSTQGFVCRFCGTAATVELFPALGRGLRPGQVGVASEGDDAACFFHADKRAETACDQCGRFVCALCDIHVGERHYCPQCFGGDGLKPAPSGITERFRLLPQRLGFLIALGGLLLGPLALAGGPVAVYFAVRGLRAPGRLTGGRGRGWAVLAMILGVVETLVWLALAVLFFIGVWTTRSR